MTTKCPPAIKKTANRKKSVTSKETSKKLARTFRRAAVESSFVQFIQATSPCVKDSAELNAHAKKLLSTELEFIASPSFSEPGAEAEILGDILLGTGCEEAGGKTAKTPDLPSHLARLCETKLLTPNEEKALFARMNFRVGIGWPVWPTRYWAWDCCHIGSRVLRSPRTPFKVARPRT
ncbi:MAG: hypothetical protein ACK578_19730, partial [Pirellula sp.]